VDPFAKFMLRQVPHPLRNEAEDVLPRQSFASFRICDDKIKCDGEKKGIPMDQLIRLKTITSPVLITLSLLCFALLAKVQAVVPPPDGGYANFNTAEGQNALFSLTTGSGNTGVGWSSLLSVSTGSFNTGVGAGTLVLNTADSNTATGAAALLLNTTGTANTANGTATLVNNSSGNSNSAFGAFALNNNVVGDDNTAIGNSALMNNINNDNTAIGSGALQNNATANSNTAIGFKALFSNTGVVAVTRPSVLVRSLATRRAPKTPLSASTLSLTAQAT
jgi:hypothetical protein